jgi:hypothetical protein
MVLLRRSSRTHRVARRQTARRQRRVACLRGSWTRQNTAAVNALGVGIENNGVQEWRECRLTAAGSPMIRILCIGAFGQCIADECMAGPESATLRRLFGAATFSRIGTTNRAGADSTLRAGGCSWIKSCLPLLYTRSAASSAPAPQPPASHRCVQDRGASIGWRAEETFEPGLPKQHGGISKTVLSGRRPWRGIRRSASGSGGSGMSPECHLFDFFWNKSGGFVRPKSGLVEL